MFAAAGHCVSSACLINYPLSIRYVDTISVVLRGVPGGEGGLILVLLWFANSVP